MRNLGHNDTEKALRQLEDGYSTQIKAREMQKVNLNEPSVNEGSVFQESPRRVELP